MKITSITMAYSPHQRAILKRSRQQFREGQWLSEEEFWSQFEPAQPPKAPVKRRSKKPQRPGSAAGPAA
jgi:hypothetical protein